VDFGCSEATGRVYTQCAYAWLRRTAHVERVDAIDCLPYDLHVARAHAELLAHVAETGTPRGAHDLIIAATAKATDRTLVTLDRRGFAGLPGVRVRSA
jgi:tRNA(fMet)-specific endonuclease VapC